MSTDPDAMDLDPHTTTTTTTTIPSNPLKTTRPPLPPTKTTTTTTTLKNPPFAYAHLTLLNPATTTTPTTAAPATLDALQVRSYLTAALRQFLGDTGAAMPIDILQLQPPSVWVRVSRPDLAAFAAGVTAFAGLPAGQGQAQGQEGRMVLQVRACGDWLGALIGDGEEAALWD